MDLALALLLLVIMTALVFEFINGFHDTANAIATVVSTKVLSPRAAVMWAAFWNLIGALVGELIGSSRGLGWYIERSAGQLDTTGVFTGIVILIAIAMVAGGGAVCGSRDARGRRRGTGAL